MAVKTPDTREEQDSAYNPEKIKNAEQQAAGDSLDDHPINTGDASGVSGDLSGGPRQNIDDALTQEKNTNPMNFSSSETPGKSGGGRFFGTRKKSASLLITLGLLGGGFGASFLGAPGLLLVQMKEIFTNYGSSTSRAAVPRYNKMLKYMIGDNSKVDKACASKPTGKKCTLGTMSNEQKSNYEKAKFKIKGKTINGRTRVASVEFPDGKVVKNGNDFTKYTKKNVGAASAAKLAHNPGTKVFNGGRFSSNVLKKFGLNKKKEDVSGKNDKERKADFNKRTGNDISDNERSSRFRAKYEGRITSGATPNKLSRFTNVLGLACAGYNIAKITTAAVKIENGLRFASFAFIFLKAADQIKNKGEIKPETVSLLGGVLTATVATGPKAGLSATDSQGYKIAAYGGEGLLKKFTKAFLLGGNPVLIFIDNTIQSINKMAGGRHNVRTACRGAGNLALVLALIAAICLGQALAEGGAGTMIVPGLGTLSGLGLGIITCAAIELVVIFFFSQLVSFMIGQAIPRAIEMLANANLDVNKISGVDAGNAVAVGAGVMLGTTALSRGLKPGNKSDVTTFLATTAEDQRRTDEIAVYDARNEPFNVYNQYSFLGSSLRKTGLLLRAPTSLREGLSNIGTIIRSSFQLTPSAHATPDSMPVNITNADLSDCPDKDMKDIGIDCDKMGGPQFVLSPKELDMEVIDNLEYMIDGHGFVDENGKIVDENSTYAKWLANCTEQREAPMGSTMMSIEEDDYDWGTGENCVGATGDGAASEEDLSNFRVYYNTGAEKEDGDYAPAKNTTESSTGSFTAATYNIQADDLGGSVAKTKQAAALMKSRGVAVFGAQEVRTSQFNAILDSGYQGKLSQPDGRAIFWDSNVFTLGKSGQFKIPKDGIQKPMVWAELIMNGQSVYVFNIHTDVSSSADRTAGAHATLAAINDVVGSSGAPVVVTGDMNSNYLPGSDRREVYDVFKNALDLTFEKTKNRINANCDTISNIPGKQECRASTGSHVDQIWISRNSGITVNSWENIADEETIKISDHNPVLANLSLPTASQSKLSWPVDEKWWKTNRADFLSAHPLYSGTFTSPYEKGTAADISDPPDGSPVYTMLSGKVVKTNLCGAGDGMIIETETQGGTLQIAYGHGTSPRFEVGDSVQSGEQILDLGAVGCQVRGGHVHIDMAFNAKHLCPQDVFVAMGANKPVDFASLTKKVTLGCGGRQ